MTEPTKRKMQNKKKNGGKDMRKKINWKPLVSENKVKGKKT